MASIVTQKEEKGTGYVKSKLVASGISLVLPGIGLALYDKSKKIEGIAVFVCAIILDILAVLISIFGGPVLSVISQGLCCFLTPFMVLGIFVVPVVHVFGAIHTFLRA